MYFKFSTLLAFISLKSCVTASSEEYPWCEDSTEKFEINSLKWIKSKKSCAWATEDGKQWFRCGIDEVKENCPVLCDFCQCKNYEGRFEVAGAPDGRKKSCAWAARKNTRNRCNTYPILKTMCPLACDRCIPSAQPSSQPSSPPTDYPSSTPTAEPSVSAQPSSILEDSGHTRVYTFDSSTGQWTQVGQDIDGENKKDRFSFNISISGDGKTVASAAIGWFNPGYVRVYSLDESIEQWTQLGQDLDAVKEGSTAEYDEGTGNRMVSLSEDGRTVAIGSPRSSRNDDDDFHSGNVHVYSFDSSTELWTQLGQDLEGDSYYDYHGDSVMLSNDGRTVAIGAYGADQGTRYGRVRVFSFDASTDQWTQLGQDLDGVGAYDRAGKRTSLGLSGDGSIVAVGAMFHGDTNAGHVRIFSYDASTDQWTQLGQELEGDTDYFEFGSSCSLSDDGLTVAIGAGFEDNSLGLARVYSFDVSTEQWTQLGQDFAGEDEGDFRGYSTSISSDGMTVIIGTSGDDENGSDAGRARIYSYDASTELWTQVGSDIFGEAAEDYSGETVVISSDGNTVAIGASYNDVTKY